ncbi:MAG: polyprenyl diphosphate synthase [Candidatus Woesearchaeota archaeon]|jgi:undecaprenyl diphosphate synthase|nr:polyprenyl diphosphate synthase [Candidatus Woesearchaeota archaeon]
MLNKIMQLLIKRKKDGLPRHIAITTNGKIDWANKNNKSINEVYQKCFQIIYDIIKTVVRMDMPIITIYLMPYREETKHLPNVIDNLISFFKELPNNEFIHKNKVKVSVWGKWYELPDRIIEPVKDVIDSTKDYDSFFLNLCINYNGKEELLDSCRLIARKIKAEKLEPESIDRSLFKDNLYSSQFLPIDLVIKNGNRRIPNLLLWDSANSKVFFTEKSFLESGSNDIVKAIEFYKSKQ